jgi:ParB family chromosome partitioning protein
MKGNRVLGKGLSALIPGAEDTLAPGAQLVDTVPIDQIGFDPQQPRKRFDEEKLAELAASIEEVGVLQPILVRRLRAGEGARRHPGEAADGPLLYCVVAGERRVRAARLASLPEVPVIVCSYAQTEALKVALLENIQREDLGPIEEAEALRALMDGYGATQEELAGMLGKSRSSVTNTLRMLSLEESIQSLLQAGVLARGHAKALLGMPAGPPRERLAMLCRSRGLSVREVERRVQAANRPRRTRRTAVRKSAGDTPEVRALRARAEQLLGSPVTISRDGKTGKGTIAVDFYSDDDFTRLLGIMGVDTDLA